MNLINIVVFIGLGALAVSDGARSCICTREYHPICASDERTYSNECTFECKKQSEPTLSIKFYSECKQKIDDQQLQEHDCFCTREIFEVCGSDNRTYYNQCALKCEQRKQSGLTLKHFGKCHGELKI